MAQKTLPIMSDATGQKIASAIEGVSIVPADRRNIGELVFSSLPLNDANLHLADGTYIARGAYSDFYDYVLSLYNLGNQAVVSYSSWADSKAANGGPIGRYGVDTTNQRIYLPDFSNTFVEGTNTAAELGSFIAAGVPNITGEYRTSWSDISGGGFVNSGQYDGALFGKKNGTAYYGTTGTSGTDYYNYIGLDASRSSSVYGNSTTVQPQAIKQYVYIVVANTYRAPMTIAIDEVMTDIAGIQSDIADIQGNVDFLEGLDWSGQEHDLNSATRTGVFRCSDSTLNIPVAVNGNCIVQEGNSSSLTQTWIGTDTDQVYTRRKRSDGVWGSWQRIITQNISPTLHSWADSNAGAISFNGSIGSAFSSCIRFTTQNGGHIVLGVVSTYLAVSKFDRNGNYVSNQSITSAFTD